MDWLNNPWVVGIGGGILSGLLVTALSRFVFSRRERREYLQKIQSADREIIYALRPGISEEHFPDQNVVESLVNATARKYAVDKEDLLSPPQIGEELVKEIMDSSFIAASTKQQYCKQLEPLTQTSVDLGTERGGVSEDRRAPLAEYRSRMVWMTSVMVGATTTMTTMVYVISRGFANDSNQSLALVLPAAGALLATLMAAVLTLLRERLGLRRDGTAHENSGKGSEIE